MAILFAILKTILKLLLIILALVIILILLVFFVPFRYKVASVKSPDTIEAVATVTWLLRMLTVEVGYSLSSGRRLTKDIRIFGISLFKVKAWLQDRKRSKAEKEREKRRQEKRAKLERMKTEDPERYEQLRAEALARKREEKRRIEEEQRRKRQEEEKRKEEERIRLEAERAEKEAREKEAEEERLRKEAEEKERLKKEAEETAAKQKEVVAEQAEPKGGILTKILKAIRKVYVKILIKLWKILSGSFRLCIKFIVTIWKLPGRIISRTSGVFEKVGTATDKVGSILDKLGDIFYFLQDEHTQAVIGLMRKQIGRLIGHIIPRKLCGYVQFGLDDPYLTGRVLATACAFYPLYGKTFRLEPDFEQLIFNCKADVEGRVYLFYLTFIALTTYFNKNTKYVINYVKSFMNKEEAE